ncbi:MAG: hypothetical protein ACERKK_07130 [Poseidonibacter sp.]
MAYNTMILMNCELSNNRSRKSSFSLKKTIALFVKNIKKIFS